MIEVRALTAHAEFDEAVRLQKEIWGFEEIELLPVRLFVVASKVGGQVLGAYDGRRMAGFCLAIPGLKPGGKYYLHSHMLGVSAEYRNAGVGRLLKLRQRDDAISRGVRLIEWTFDPLEIKNAYFNVVRLGAIVRRYVCNQYGTTSSHLHGGLPTDRCTAEWWLTSPRVEAIVNGQPYEHPQIIERVTVPLEIANLRENNPQQAREIQQSLSKQLLPLFDRGFAVIGFQKSEQAGTYLLGHPDIESWQSN